MESRRVRFWAVAVAMALAGPAFAAERARDESTRATQQIEKARTAIEAALQPREGEAAATKPGGRERLLLRAQRELDKANRDFEQGVFRAAEHHALRAATMAWRASAPRKGEE